VILRGGGGSRGAARMDRIDGAAAEQERDEDEK
jgi:hypothetical protein